MEAGGGIVDDHLHAVAPRPDERPPGAGGRCGGLAPRPTRKEARGVEPPHVPVPDDRDPKRAHAYPSGCSAPVDRQMPRWLDSQNSTSSTTSGTSA